MKLLIHLFSEALVTHIVDTTRSVQSMQLPRKLVFPVIVAHVQIEHVIVLHGGQDLTSKPPSISGSTTV